MVDWPDPGLSRFPGSEAVAVLPDFLPPDPGAPLHPERPLRLRLPPGEPLDLLATFRCGQVFRWARHGDTWYGPHGPGSLAVRAAGDGVEVRARGVDLTAGDAWRFLGLDRSLRRMATSLAADPWVSRALAVVPGLRLLRQDPWDCLAGYVCSQWNNIPKIELSTERIARAWGTVHAWEGGVEVASLPSAARLAGLDAEALRPCALGYRCRYLVETARRVAAGEVDPAALRSASYEEALAVLLGLPGIGRKVADCILLFSLDQPAACPVDVWVRRVIHELYAGELERYLPDAAARAEKPLSGREYGAIARFARDRWGEDAGYAQQYLFHTRRSGLLGPCPDPAAGG